MMPVPSAAVLSGLPRLAKHLAWQRGIDHITENEALWLNPWAVNRAVAEASVLGVNDFARKRPAFFAYLRERLSKWSEEVGRHRGVRYGSDEGAPAVLQVAESSMELINRGPKKDD